MVKIKSVPVNRAQSLDRLKQYGLYFTSKTDPLLWPEGEDSALWLEKLTGTSINDVNKTTADGDGLTLDKTPRSIWMQSLDKKVPETPDHLWP